MNITDPEKLESALLPKDPDARARYLDEREHKLRLAAREAKAQAFAAAVRAGESKRAGELYLAEPGHTERLAMIRECEAAELLAWIPTVKPAVREAVLAAHPDRPTIEHALIPTEKLPRFVVLTRARLTGDALAMVGRTDDRRVSDKQADRLRAAGVPLKQQKGDRDPRESEWVYRGWEPSEALLRASVKNDGGIASDVEPEETFVARLAVDDELAEHIRAGKLCVQTRCERDVVADHPTIAKLKADAAPTTATGQSPSTRETTMTADGSSHVHLHAAAQARS